MKRVHAIRYSLPVLLIACDCRSVRADQRVALKDMIRRLFEIHVIGDR
jgi:hypothetical protein